MAKQPHHIRLILFGLFVLIVIGLTQVGNRGLGKAAGSGISCAADADCAQGQLCMGTPGSSSCTAITATGCALPGDANGDNILDCTDIGCATALVFGKTQNGCNVACADLAPTGTPDGTVNVGDLGLFYRLIPNCYQQ